MNNDSTFDPSDYLSTPADLALRLREFATEADTWRRIPVGLSGIDRAIVTGLYPGSMTTIVARPGHGKSLMVKGVVKRECRRIMKEGRDDCVIMVTLEEPPERVAIEVADWPISFQDIIRGEYDRHAIDGLVAKYPKVPLWTISHPRVRKGKRPKRLTPDLIFDLIEGIASDYDGKRPSLIALDYLQILHPGDHVSTGATRTAQVEAVSHAIKSLAVRLNCPVITAVQSARVEDKRHPPIPELSDMQHTSAIEQDSDIILSLWRPIKTSNGVRRDGRCEIGDRYYPFTDDLTVIRLLKQRNGIGSGQWICELDYKTQELREVEAI